MGCGPLGILDLLSQRVGPAGEVVGLELEPQFIQLARGVVNQRALANVEVVEGDARATGLPRASFDLVHERLLLVGPTREPVLSEMIDLANLVASSRCRRSTCWRHFVSQPIPRGTPC